MENEMQDRVARLVAMKRHEVPSPDHYVGLSRAVRFRLEQERIAAGKALTRRTAASGWLDGWSCLFRAKASRWMEPSAWVPTVLAGMAILAWVFGDAGGSSVLSPGLQTAGFGGGARPLLGLEAPKSAPIIGVHVRTIFLDSDQLPADFVAFPRLPAGVAGK